MHTISRKALVPYTAGQMFALVNDIESYPLFLPWCRSARVLERRDSEVKAALKLSKGGIEKTFTTLNRAFSEERIDIKLVEGPFRRLEGYWRFEPMGEHGSRVSLDLHFEFSNPLLRLTLGPVFHQVGSALVDAFVGRARQLYGSGGTA